MTSLESISDEARCQNYNRTGYVRSKWAVFTSLKRSTIQWDTKLKIIQCATL